MDIVKITGYSGPVKMHNVTIPTSVETGKDIYKTVTTIGEGAFRAGASIEKLVIPDGITVIEPYAFEGCVQMVSITLPSTLEVLGDGAFYQCGITSLTIPTSEKLTRIGSCAFFECDKLQEVTIPGNIKTVGEEAFRKCSGLKKVVLSEGVVTVETLGFYGCVSLEELELAYAITVHKSQGSEYPAVIIPLLTGSSLLLHRNLLYTAVTRAKKCVTIVGMKDTVNYMIENERELRRYSTFDIKIKEMIV